MRRSTRSRYARAATSLWQARSGREEKRGIECRIWPLLPCEGVRRVDVKKVLRVIHCGAWMLCPAHGPPHRNILELSPRIILRAMNLLPVF